jgi:hypothetical protein
MIIYMAFDGYPVEKVSIHQLERNARSQYFDFAQDIADSTST